MNIFTVISPVIKNDTDISLTAKSLILLSKKIKFEWIIVCPRSEFKNFKADKLLNKISFLRVICEKNNSIYGAYNTALNLVKSKYYLPLSSGDTILEKSSKCLITILGDKNYINSYIIFFSVLKSGKIIRAHDTLFSLIRTSGFSSGHSSSCLISMKAHKKFGYYDERFKMAADNYFFELVYKYSRDRISWVPDCLLGYFKGGGISVQNMSETLKELYLSRVLAGRSKFKEKIILIYRYIKYIFFAQKTFSKIR